MESKSTMQRKLSEGLGGRTLEEQEKIIAEALVQNGVIMILVSATVGVSPMDEENHRYDLAEGHLPAKCATLFTQRRFYLMLISS
jgi:hypothetical protein